VVARLMLPDQPHLEGRTTFPAIETGGAASKPASKIGGTG
jgi:hypothetical protein